ncbi:MAG: enoyl-CoA hydratase/isomerase family protein [Betaproteobacteria bacterium]|nr:enoyl-CoA hydratase/isomerase family protein [Betaproteobacteria bacterium]
MNVHNNYSVRGDFPEDARTLTVHVRQESVMAAREARETFLAAHIDVVYSRLTGNYAQFLRLDKLVAAASDLIEGLIPNSTELEQEARLPLADQTGVAIDQMLFLAHVLNHRTSGEHLCQAMRLPRADSVKRLDEFSNGGNLVLAAASLERIGKTCFLTLNCPDVLNAEDERSLDDVETAVDLALLDPHSEVVVLRGAPVAKYGGQRAFCSGINLTRLQEGKIPPMWYLQRELGVLNKIYRGLAQPKIVPEAFEETQEKPWIAQLDKFAIGGGCQYLLVMDSIVAGTDAYMSLPARKEGIIPGAANLRLQRFVGDRLARQMVLADRRIACDSTEGRMICDQVVAPEQIEAAVQDLVLQMTSSGVVSFTANRRAFRLAQEPLDLFRRYMALYAREQAFCHFSPALAANLRKHWRDTRTN